MANDFSIYVGDSRTLTVVVKDETLAAVNITGATIKWVLVNNGGTILQKDNGAIGGITITNATQGQFSIALLATNTSQLKAGSYTHQARLTDSSGNSSIIFKETVTVNDSNV